MTDNEQSPEPRRKLTCFYMGRATAEVLTVLELRDRWTLVEMGEDINKCEGRQFEDADDAKEFEDCPLDWKDGKATETGCGPWWSGVGRNTLTADDDTVALCDALLVRAGLPKLTLVTKNAAPDFEATFDMEGSNYEQLDALDRAEWRLRPLSADEQRALDAEEPFDLDDALAQ